MLYLRMFEKFPREILICISFWINSIDEETRNDVFSLYESGINPAETEREKKRKKKKKK